MRILHVVKTSDGAGWAANQAAVLAGLGAEIHVALPRREGHTVAAWRRAGAEIHVADLSMPVRHPGRYAATARAARRLVEEIQPDLIHSHFVTTTLALRLALGKSHRTPRIFQVPGPLHLEHWHTSRADVATAGDADFWIASSRCINEHYRRAAVPEERRFLSYPGWRVQEFSPRREYYLHRHLRLDATTRLVGNINVMYPPKYFLGQRVGLKCHEDVIDALGLVTRRVLHTKGVVIGDSYGLSPRYEQRLAKRARQVAGDNILLPGRFDSATVARSWPDFDCAVHVPLSENCGGVLEPLLAGVPVVASNVGGIPELVMDGVTGKLVPPRQPEALAQAVVGVMADLQHYRDLAETGSRLVRHMFDVERTGREVYAIYRHILQGSDRPREFNSQEHVRQLSIASQAVPLEEANAWPAVV